MAKSKEKKKAKRPSLEEIRERVKAIPFRDLLDRELLLFVMVVAALLFMVHMLYVGGQEGRIVKLTKEKERLEKDVEKMAAVVKIDQVEALGKELMVLRQSNEEKETELAKMTRKYSDMSRGQVLRRITMAQVSDDWQIVSIEEMEKVRQAGQSSVSMFRIKGEGVFHGLIDYLSRLEQTTAAASLQRMDITRKEDGKRTLIGTFDIRVAGGPTAGVAASLGREVSD